MLRLDPKLHRQLKDLASGSGCSLNEYCERALSTACRSATFFKPSSIDKGLQDLPDSWSRELLGVILFGSVARGEECAGSDIDLLLVFKNDFEIHRDLYRFWDREIAPSWARHFGTKREISPQFVHQPKKPESASSLWLETALDGRVLWEKDSVISDFLIRLRRWIAEGHVTRQVSHGQGYWIRTREGKRTA